MPSGCGSRNPAINELSQTLQSIFQKISTQQETRTTESGTIFSAENEASKVKA